MDKSIRLIDITVGQLEELIAETVKETIIKQSKIIKEEHDYVYGLSGLAECLGKNKNYVSYMLSAGLLERYTKAGAISRQGKQIITDKTLLLSLIAQASS